MMTKEEYVARAAAEDDWAPGWEAIDQAFDVVYPGVEPAHLATLMPARAQFGGQEYLDGVSIFPNPNGFQHLVTYGHSVLYVDEESYGAVENGWGYELTAKVKADNPDDAKWMAGSFSNLARYTFTSKRWFEPFQFISGSGNPLHTGRDTMLTSYLVVPDTQVLGVDSVHGRLDFLQLVGITQPELDWLASSPQGAADRARELAGLIAAESPNLVTDLDRTHNYI